jgi:hypothetical protein
MIIYESEAEDGTPWEVGIRTDVRSWWFNAVPTSSRVFCFEEELEWENETLAWPVNGEKAHRVVDHINLHWEPPAEEELEATREQNWEWEKQLVDRFT